VARATEGLRKENDKLGRLVEVHTKKVKEIGNVQNWAEMLEREFVILEETLRLVNGGGGSGSDEDEGSEGSWSGSGMEEEGEEGEEDGEEDGGEGSGVRERRGEEGGGEENGGVGDRKDGEGDVVMRDGPQTVPLPDLSPPGKTMRME
jgi:hypothetical protein